MGAEYLIRWTSNTNIYIPNMHTDPLYEYEQKLISSFTRPSLLTLFWRGAKLLTVYLLLSGTIFSVLLGMLNFSAYSARLLDWIDPNQLVALQEDLTSAIARSSIDAHADATAADIQHIAESSEVLTERVATIAP